MNRVTIQANPNLNSPIISPEIQGQFAEHLGHCIYGGIWVGEESDIPHTRGIRNDVVDALRAIRVPVIRWPGGCFADEYHWRDGIGPRDQRPSIYNSHWGGVVENNHFGTHEFFDLCEQVGCDPYVCGNVGSGTVQEMQQWVEYITSPADSPMANLRRKNGREAPWKLTYFGVGNESWGCGGHMRPEYYADLFRRYNTYVRTYGAHKIQRVACGPNVADYAWTETLMREAKDHMDGLSLHSYTLLDQKWPPSGSSTEFETREWFSILESALQMEHLIGEHSKIMDQSDPDLKVSLVVDEWGTWYPSEPGTNPGFLFQQNTLRDAIVASLHLDIFHRHCERVRMANIAQMVNVLQAMILTDGPNMVLTPTYHVFEMYAGHQGAQRIDLAVECDTLHALPSVSATASEKHGVVLVCLTCLDPQNGREVEVAGLGVGLELQKAKVLTASTMQSHNTFESPSLVQPCDAEVGVCNDLLSLTLSPMSVTSIYLRVKS
ncbi:MAG: alpha-N-arabinofuranosidase [Fimbriimonadaceae bacterium]|nr:alpha-N-arabinofuranosidase [Fimbriimonadaceae bacterium]